MSDKINPTFDEKDAKGENEKPSDDPTKAISSSAEKRRKLKKPQQWEWPKKKSLYETSCFHGEENGSRKMVANCD